MTPAYTLLIPHKSNPGNDAALKVCLDCLLDNSVYNFHLIIDREEDAPLYPRINGMVEQAITDYVIYWSSDMFVAPGWDVDMMRLAAPDAFVTCVLVEPGMIGVHPHNLLRDFGRKPETFRRAEFEAWCSTEAKSLNLSGKGWVAPVMWPRKGFLDMGGLRDGNDPDAHGFTSGDIDLFERWEAAGNRVTRARNSYAFHLQRFSMEEEQNDPKRG